MFVVYPYISGIKNQVVVQVLINRFIHVSTTHSSGIHVPGNVLDTKAIVAAVNKPSKFSTSIKLILGKADNKQHKYKLYCTREKKTEKEDK